MPPLVPQHLEGSKAVVHVQSIHQCFSCMWTLRASWFHLKKGLITTAANWFLHNRVCTMVLAYDSNKAGYFWSFSILQKCTMAWNQAGDWAYFWESSAKLLYKHPSHHLIKHHRLIIARIGSTKLIAREKFAQNIYLWRKDIVAVVHIHLGFNQQFLVWIKDWNLRWWEFLAHYAASNYRVVGFAR